MAEHQDTPRHRKNKVVPQLPSLGHPAHLPHELGLELELEGADQGVELGQEKRLVVITAKSNELKSFKFKLRNARMSEGEEDKDPKNKPKGVVLEAMGLANEENVFSLHGLTLEGTKLSLQFRVTVRACSGQIGH